MNIIVTGSLGNISRPLAQQLLKEGNTVYVISHNPDRKPAIEALGAIPAIGPLDDIDFLTETFTGADAVYCMVPPNFTEVDQRAYYRRIGNAYCQAIRQSDIKQVVHLSSWGAHLSEGTGLIIGCHDVENMLNELKDVNITHLRPSSFFYSLKSFCGMIKQDGFIGLNYGDNDKAVLVHTDDIARTAAEELQKTVSCNSIRYVASEEMSCNEIAGILGTAIGKPDLKWHTLTNEQTWKAWAKSGVPEFLIPYLVDMGACIHSGAMGEDYELHKPELGKVKLKDFADEFAIAYNEI